MVRVDIRIAALLLALVVPLAACGEQSAPADTTIAVDRVHTPGPIRPGFKGEAYAVPTSADESARPDSVPVTLQDKSGKVVGTDFVHSGQPHQVATRRGDEDHVAIPWANGLTAIGARKDFWSMPNFIGLKDMTVTVNGKTTPLGFSGIGYHRATPAQFDDKSTPQYDGIAPTTQTYLHCQDPNWGIGQQTFTVDFIEDGVHRHDKAVLQKGIVGMDWGIAVPIQKNAIHKLYRDCDGKTTPDYGYTHQTTQWLEAMSRAVYLLAASDWAGEYRSKIDTYIAHIELVASLLSEKKNFDYWKGEIPDPQGHDYTHRTFMMAAALGMASTLTDNAKDSAHWADLAASIVQRGIGNQFKNGVNPEHNGYDVQYQMYGTWLAELYRGTLDPKSPLKPKITNTINKAIAWYTTRINKQTGQINIAGSTRVCAETNWWSGKATEYLDTAEAVRALLFWGHTQNEPKLVDLAILVDHGQKTYRNACPVPPQATSTTVTTARSS